MNTLFDTCEHLNIDDIIAEQPTFQRIMEDGVVTPEEIQQQANTVVTLLRDFERSATPEQIEQLRHILAELSVLIAVNNIKTRPDKP